MSFGQSGFGSGFGTTNQQQNTGFGGFGTNTNNNTNNTTGFGTQANTGFGATNTTANTGGSLFGGGQNTAGGFGTSGFGAAAQPSGFGAARPTFGAANTATNTGGSLFGTATPATNTGFGGFGTAQPSTTTGFGTTTNNGGSLFGQSTQQNTGFGAANTGSSMFGGGTANTTTANTGFGGGAQSNAGGFGGFGGVVGGAVATQNQGTAGTPFTEHTEKDQSQTNKFQSISCQPQYINWSFEELRLVDYNQGRRFGNQTGQTGAFGTSTGFGGFGQPAATGGFGSTTTGGSLFGQPAAAATGGFGTAATTNNSGFGSTTGGGLFGAAKPAAGGLFGSTTPAASGAASGGLFGTQQQSNTTSFGQPASGFGAATNTNTSLFGGTQQKPSLFGTQSTNTGFGNTTNNSGAFGQPAATNSNSLFGNNNQSTGFGATTNQTSSPFGGFANTANQQNVTQNQSGGLFGGGFGGATQNKSPFGTTNTNTSTNLFGQPAQQTQQTTLFGNPQQPQQSGGLFGENKPAPSGGLFGGLSTNTNTTPSLFGNPNSNNTTNQTTSLFGNPQQKPSLFGGSGTTAGNSLFGGQGQSQPGGNSLFGGTQNPQPSGANLFGGSLNQSMLQPQQQGALVASIMSNNPYGNDALFANLMTTPQAPGPLATPLSSSQKARKPAPLPTYRLSPAASTRLITPQKRNGYGFEYSSYGTPGSALSNASPGLFGASLLQNGRLGNTLGRSLSTSNIRGSLSPLGSQESILNPNAFSSGGLRGNSASLKKLRINRNIRTDLFDTDASNDAQRSSPLKKSVSFNDQSTSNDHREAIEAGQANGETSKALVPVEDGDGPEPSAEEQGFLRSSRDSNKQSRSNGASSRQEMEQVQGNELAVVPENGPSPAVPPKPSVSREENARLSHEDQQPGEYYMTPTKEELKKMSRKQLSSVKDLVVGRVGTGKIEFSEVDLTNIDIDKICGGIVRLEMRSATVYAEDANKAPPGKGLNVPSLVTLDNSWPRSKGGKLPVYERKGPRFDKHLERLKRVAGTEFVEYKVETGQWLFRVDHFSTYRLDYGDENMSSPMIDDAVDTPSPLAARALQKALRSNGFMASNGSPTRTSSPLTSNIDDTSEFRKSGGLPGSFDQDVFMEQAQEEDDMDYEIDQDSGSNGHIHAKRNLDDSTHMSGALRSYDGAFDVPANKQLSQNATLLKPKSILKASQHQAATFGTPSRARPTVGADWATQLQHTISPKKQNRENLRESQGLFLKAPKEQQDIQRTQSTFGKETAPFATSIDVMNSLFGNSTTGVGKKQGAAGKGFQWPHAKRSKRDLDSSKLNEQDKAFHQSFKPSWAPDGTLVYTGVTSESASNSAQLVTVNAAKKKDLQFVRLNSASVQIAPPLVRKQREISSIDIEDGVARVRIVDKFAFADFASIVDGQGAASTHEKQMWQLASILFDGLVAATNEEKQMLRKRNFDTFWQDIVTPLAVQQAAKLSTLEEAAIVHLSSHNIWTAIDTLIAGRNYRLATLVAQIGTSAAVRKDMAAQIDEWRSTDVLSEISPPIRALYELLAGNTCISDGKGGVGRENKAETFNISSRFRLDWKRAFGLRLWYGTLADESLLTAIHQYWDDVVHSRAGVNPIPWFIEQTREIGVSSDQKESRQDMLWGLLQVFAATQEAITGDRKIAPTIKLAGLISPQNLTNDAMDARLSFQLYQLLSACHVADFDELEREHKADILANDYLFQLAPSSANLCDAVFVALHLSDAEARRAAVEELLDHHAGSIGANSDSCDVFRTLTEKLRIPTEWIYTAKALHAKAVLGDDREEARNLLRAGKLEQAHSTLKTVVAPRAVIEEDLEGLLELLQEFIEAGADGLKSWDLGGAVYAEFVQLVLRQEGKTYEDDEGLLERLMVALSEMSGPRLGLEERVAVTVMADQVADIAGKEFAELQSLPVSTSGNLVLQDAVILSEEFYARFAGSDA